MSSVLQAALNYRACGLSVVPLLTDGSRQPPFDWKEYQSRLATEDELKKWFVGDRYGIAITGGLISGGLEIIDLESVEIAKRWQELVRENGAGNVLPRLLIVKTPKGFHCYFKTDSPGRNVDLARRHPTEQELIDKPKQRYHKLIETRGEGGFVVAPGSPVDTHPKKIAYALVQGDYANIPHITAAEREILLEAARSLNEYFKDHYTEPHSETEKTPTTDRPGDIFEARASWSDVLVPHGWKLSGPGRWIRPGGKRDSAMEILDGHRLWVFSSSVKELPFEIALSKYATYCFLNCGNDFNKAAKELAAKGYCLPREQQKPAPQVSAPPAETPPSDDEIRIREWPTLPSDALYGYVGRFIAAATESSEADPAAVLAAFLVRAGAAFGANAWIKIADDKHFPRLYGMVVGASANARKGTSLGPVRRVFEAAEARLTGSTPLNVVKGLSSGEGVIGAVRDKREKAAEDEGDEGVVDKRLFVEEGEFGSALKAMQRPGNTLSPVVRSAWDTSNLGILTRKDPLKASNAHICILGQITRRELADLLEKIELSNGLANRFLWFCARRSKTLCFPQGISDEIVPQLAGELAAAIQFGQRDRIVNLDLEASAMWQDIYEEITKDYGGILGEVTARGPSQILRIALIYSILERCELIGVQHLRAAVAVWEYCLASAKYIFTSGSDISEGATLNVRITDALRGGEKTQAELQRIFRNTIPAKRLAAALTELQAIGRISQSRGQSAGGRAPIIWKLAAGEGGRDGVA
jgi:hypothetical protein